MKKEDKKVSQILRLCLAIQSESAVLVAAQGEACDYVTRLELAGLCFCLNHAQRVGQITWQEGDRVRQLISERMGNFGWLSSKLKSQKKGSTLAHRQAYYKRWISQLEKKGL